MDKDSIKNKKIFIRKHADELSIKNKKDILQLLKFKIDNSKIKEVSDGIRINLDTLDDSIINEIYSLTEYKLLEEKTSK